MCLHRRGRRKFARDFYSGESWSQFNWIICKKEEATTMRTVFQRGTLPAYWLSNNSLSSCFFFFLISSRLTFYSSSPLRHRPPVRQHPNPEKKIQFSLITSISIFFDKDSKDIHSMDFIRCFPGYGRKERR